MTSRLSDADANNELNVRFGGAASNAPATYYLGLSSTEPQPDGTGITEPTASAYARVAITNDATHWPNAAGRVKSNGLAITFPTPGTTPVTDDWGDVLYWVLWDHATLATSSHYRAGGALDSAGYVAAGDAAPYFDPGTFVISAPAD